MKESFDQTLIEEGQKSARSLKLAQEKFDDKLKTELAKMKKQEQVMKMEKAIKVQLENDLRAEIEKLK